MTNQTLTREATRCDSCGQIDDHPRHHLANAQGVTSSHVDCCADAGCEVCKEILAQAPPKSRHGAALVAHLEGA
jgi:hypothetical protein